MRRAVDPGVHVVVQPRQLHDTGDAASADRSARRLSPTRRIAQMLDAGLVLAGSSDAPVFTSTCSRRSKRRCAGAPPSGATLAPRAAHLPSPRRCACTRAAPPPTLGMDGEIGQLRPGARADAVVLSEELERVPAERMGEVGVLSTFAGRVDVDAV